MFAALATAISCHAAWPGFMSYDSLYTYAASGTGVDTALWPPLHAYLFWFSRAAGAETWGLFAAQTFLLFLAAGITIHLTIASRGLAALLCLLFAATFAAIPAQIGVLSAHWRDVPTASFTLAGLALYLLSARKESRVLLAAGITSLGLAVALRYNAILLVAGLLLIMIWRPVLGNSTSGRVTAIMATVIALALAWASTHWRAPDFSPLAQPDSLGGTREFDLIGISACAGRVYLPAAVTGGQNISPRQVRTAYDPRHLQLSLAAKPGGPRMLETGGEGDVARTWWFLLRHEPRCYAAHRLQVFIHQMGFSREGAFYPIHAAIDPNPYGLKLARPAAAARLMTYVTLRAAKPWRQPWLLYLAGAAAGLLIIGRRGPMRQVIAALLVGSFAYAGVLYFVAPAADARYIFPSNTTAALAIVLALGLIAEERLQRRKFRVV